MAARGTARSLAKLGWTAGLVGVAVLVLAAPVSAKGPPNGKGGPPPWAGSGGSGGGPPAWAGSGGSGGGPPASAGAGKGAEKAGKVAKRAEKGMKNAAGKAAKARERAGKNPAMRCFSLLGELGEEFYGMYGTNPNNANAFGKCVSEQARKQGEDDEEAPEEEPEDQAECDDPAESEEPASEEDPLATLASFDEDTPGGTECDPADEKTGDPDESGDEDGDEPEAKLTCFLPAAAHANPFAVCIRA